ncbi:MAG: peptide deformylase [Alphaproteobacteria bacterium]|nr:MAG: peptide deformylase [Alphaproteobacteria bacterium]
MPSLSLTYGPDPIFSKTAEPVTIFDGDLRTLVEDMIETLYTEKAVGIGANMVGVLQRIVVIDLQDGDERSPQVFLNPHITDSSDDMQSHEEASICFPGISAKITRPRRISLSYQDGEGRVQSLTAVDYLATVLQHEIDYLDGRIFLDHLSPVKRKMLLRKTRKYQKLNGLG